ncbi:Baculoviral IAP repeat-containing protein 3 [Chionoecetes opilio]|uniref:Baculoviral IAP repeat-containing protein 3 n=1 Tax=Chionoecetes opilio TaxID=41210 RepID=A0A8J4YR73_CHIOP|nr:Baculoviral IAP repeat-containing protein 3 [Chionoecetes opilio]
MAGGVEVATDIPSLSLHATGHHTHSSPVCLSPLHPHPQVDFLVMLLFPLTFLVVGKVVVVGAAGQGSARAVRCPAMESRAMVIPARADQGPETLEALRNGVAELEGEKRLLEKRLQEAREVLVCRVCLDRPVAAVFMPCAHLSTCSHCSASLTTCPLCRSPIHYAAPVIL